MQFLRNGNGLYNYLFSVKNGDGTVAVTVDNDGETKLQRYGDDNVSVMKVLL